jgi:hypothetical protein
MPGALSRCWINGVHATGARAIRRTSAYDTEPEVQVVGEPPSQVSVDSVTAAVVERIRRDADFASLAACEISYAASTLLLRAPRRFLNRVRKFDSCRGHHLSIPATAGRPPAAAAVN